MFTGIIEERGEISNVHAMGDGLRFSIRAEKILSDLKTDDSVAINGCCLTVVKKETRQFDVEAVEETLKKTTLGRWQTGHFVNLERAATLETRLGGHLVLGHVDGVGTIISIEELSASHRVVIEIPKSLEKYVIPVGSITIDGISLTVAEIHDNRVTIAVIPHTWRMTNFSERKLGEGVHVEADMIAKHLEKIMLERSKI